MAHTEKMHTLPPPRNFNQMFLFGVLGTLLLVVLMFFLMSFNPEREAPDTSFRNNEYYQRVHAVLDNDERTQADIVEAIKLLDSLREYDHDVVEIHYFSARAQILNYFYSSNPEEKAVSLKRLKKHLHDTLQFEPQHASALGNLAYFAFYIEHEFDQASKYYAQSLAAEPNNFDAHIQYAQLLLSQGEREKAIHHNRIALTMDADEYAVGVGVWLYTLSGDLTSAELELAKLYSMNPRSLTYHKAAIELYEHIGDESRAFKMYMKSFTRLGYSADELREAERIFDQGGLQQLNLWLAEVRDEQRDIGQGVPPLSTARYYAAAGRTEEALDFLEATLQTSSSDLLWLGVDSKFAFIKSQERFQKLLQQLGLKE